MISKYTTIRAFYWLMCIWIVEAGGSSNRNASRDESVETGDESVETGDESIEAGENTTIRL